MELRIRSRFLLDVDPVIAVNDRSQQVVSFRNQTSRLNVLSVGSRDQNILNRSGDNLRIDWGYFHLAVPKDENSTTAIAPNPDAGLRGIPASCRRATRWACLSRPMKGARTLPRSLEFRKASARSLSRATCLSLTPRAMPSNICSGICAPTGSGTIWRLRRCSIPPKRNIPDLEARGTKFDAELAADLTRWRGTLCRDCDPGLSADACGSQAGGRRQWRPHALCQGELLQRLHCHGGCALPLGSILPFLSAQIA
jgi:hypothetical protein